LRQLPGGERYRALAVLAPGEPLLLRSGSHLAVEDERHRRIVKDRVDSEYPHELPVPQIDRANPGVPSQAWIVEAVSTGPGWTRRWNTKCAACTRDSRAATGWRSGTTPSRPARTSRRRRSSPTPSWHGEAAPRPASP